MKKDLSFSKALERLEAVVEKLESQNLDVDEAVDLLAEGLKLHKYCQEKLKVSQKKIDELISADYQAE